VSEGFLADAALLAPRLQVATEPLLQVAFHPSMPAGRYL
jgi:hypothetical protein